MAGASLVCLLIGLLFLAVQVRSIFSAQLQQEYIGLVLEAVDRAESARDAVAVLANAAKTANAANAANKQQTQQTQRQQTRTPPRPTPCVSRASN